MLDRWSTLFMAVLIVFFAMAVPAFACNLCGGDVIGVHVIAIDSPADASVIYGNTESIIFGAPLAVSSPEQALNQFLVGTLYATIENAEERGGILFASTCSVGWAGHFANNAPSSYCAAASRLHQWIKG